MVLVGAVCCCVFQEGAGAGLVRDVLHPPDPLPVLLPVTPSVLLDCGGGVEPNDPDDGELSTLLAPPPQLMNFFCGGVCGACETGGVPQLYWLDDFFPATFTPLQSNCGFCSCCCCCCPGCIPGWLEVMNPENC